MDDSAIADGDPGPEPEVLERAAPEPPAAPPQAPEPPQAAAPPTTNGPLTLEQVTSMWPAVVEIVRASNAMLAALLADARPLSVSERHLTLALPANAAFLKKKAEQDEHRRTAADAVRNVTGAALALQYELASEESVVVAAPATKLSDEEIVRRFVEELDAQEIDQETDS
jgi:hypothetical protein